MHPETHARLAATLAVYAAASCVHKRCRVDRTRLVLRLLRCVPASKAMFCERPCEVLAPRGCTHGTLYWQRPACLWECVLRGASAWPLQRTGFSLPPGLSGAFAWPSVALPLEQGVSAAVWTALCDNPRLQQACRRRRGTSTVSSRSWSRSAFSTRRGNTRVRETKSCRAHTRALSDDQVPCRS